MCGRSIAVLGILYLAMPSLVGAQIDPQGGDMQVNTVTANGQQGAVVASGAEDGDFLVVWQNNGGLPPDVSETAISGQLFTRTGAPIGSEFLVNELTTGSQRSPEAAMAPDGSFIVVWTHDEPTATDPDGSVRGRRFEADGSPLGDEFQVNSETFQRADRPDVAIEENGDFVVAWRRNSSYYNDSLRGRRFEADGTPKDSDFAINIFSFGDLGYGQYLTTFSKPKLEGGAQGEFLVAWSTLYSGPKVFDQDVKMRIFDAEGTGGPELAVANVSYVYSFSGVDAARKENGDFLVVWATTEETPIQVDRYRADGSLIESVDVGSFGSDPHIAANPAGDFLVAWTSLDGEILGRPYTADGEAQSEAMQLNSYTTELQTSVDLTVDADGFVATWTSGGSAGTDTDGASVQQRLFDWEGSRIFADGFESGDTSAWLEGTFP